MYVADSGVDRHRLLVGLEAKGNDEAVLPGKHLTQADCGDVLLLKGNAWPGNRGKPFVQLKEVSSKFEMTFGAVAILEVLPPALQVSHWSLIDHVGAACSSRCNTSISPWSERGMSATSADHGLRIEAVGRILLPM
jgi:hypothetical protein